LATPALDKVRHEIMHTFGYFVTESSEHNAEYMPYFIKSKYPELIDKYEIPLDEYIGRCIMLINGWGRIQEGLVNNKDIRHEHSIETAANILEAIETDKPYRLAGNVLNNGVIPNLPREACVEVPCLVDRNGVAPCFVGELPLQLAALNMTNINTQLLTIEAALTLKKEYIYHAALMDPHTSSELSIDNIRSLCDDMIKEHGNWLPRYY